MKHEERKPLINEFYNGKILNFHQINDLCDNHISSVLDYIDLYLTNGILDIRKIIDKLHKDLVENNLFEVLTNSIYEQELNPIYFSDINTNKEIIRVINYKIHYEIKSFDFNNNFELRKEDLDSEYIYHYFMSFFCYQAINFLFTLKNYFVPDLKIDYENNYNFYKETEKQQKSDNRKSRNAPTNAEKLKALKEFCPELITKLHKSNLNKNEQGQIIYLITGVNKTDAYKKIITSDSKALDNTIIKNDEIDFENLKNKLNNT